MDISELPENPQLPLYIDSSILSSWRSCKQKAFRAYIQNIAPRGESIHLLAGGAFAAGCEAARIAQFKHSPNKQLTTLELLHAAMPAFLAAWKGHEIDGEVTKNPHNVFHALENYFNEYPPYTDMVQPLIKPDGFPAVEFNFSIPLPVLHPSGTPYVFVGRFDMLGLYGDRMVILDEKTTSALGTYWMQSWDMRGQFCGYTWACQQLGYSVDHVIVGGVAIQKTQHQFLRVPVQYPNFLIERWYNELLYTLHEMNQCYEAQVWNYNFGDACTSYGGCSFKELCLAEHPDQWLNNFEPRTWSPIPLDSKA